MKILSIQTARSIWLFPTKFLNPKGRSIIPALEGIIDRYSFIKSAPLDEALGSEMNGLELKAGSFHKQNGVPIDVSVTIYSDGLVADTSSSTEDSDLFLIDALTFLSNNFDLVSYSELPIHKLFLSEVFFTLNEVPDFFSEFTNSFMNKSSRYIDRDKFGDFSFMGINLATDPKLSGKTSFIRIERELNTPFDENRFYSTGSIKTSHHIELLVGLETA